MREDGGGNKEEPAAVGAVAPLAKAPGQQHPSYL